MSSHRSSRLPGVVVEAQPRHTTDGLPRMDVAGFVGVAPCGPFDTPVVIEDVPRFREIFGPDIRLTDQVDGHAETWSLLGPTVEAFFASGGKRCWVVRVGAAEEAATTGFTVPGLVSVGDADDLTSFEPTVLFARAPGSNFDSHTVGAWASRRRLALVESFVELGEAGGELVCVGRSSVQPGDLLEVVFVTGTKLWAPVDCVGTEEFGRIAVRWRLESEVWVAPASERLRPTSGLAGRLVGNDEMQPLDVADYRVDRAGNALLQTPSLTLPLVPGALVMVDVEGGDRETFVLEDAGSVGSRGMVTLRSRMTLRHVPRALARATAPAVGHVDVVKLGLGLFDGSATRRIVDRLDFAPDGERAIRHLASDRRIFGDEYRRQASRGGHPPPGPLDAEISTPRLDVAAEHEDRMTVPLGLHGGLGVATRGAAIVGPGSAARRNGVDRLAADWFVDPSMRSLGVQTLFRAACEKFFVDQSPLRGCHSLVPLDEVAVVAAPDCLHRGWIDVRKPVPVALPPPVLEADEATDALNWSPYPGPASAEFVLEWSPTSDFSAPGGTERLIDAEGQGVRDGCDRQWYRVRAECGAETSPWSNTVALIPGTGAFTPCAVDDTAAPELGWSDDGLSWRSGLSDVAGPGWFELATASDPLFETARCARVHTPHMDQPVAFRPPVPAGTTFYARVRHLARPPGPWSNTAWRSPEPSSARVPTPGAGLLPTAIETHRALAVLAASRGDLTILLSFPEPYSYTEIAEHLADLRDSRLAGGDADADPFDFLHAHHPWVQLDSHRWAPVDGAVAGALADHAVRHGPWIASVPRPFRSIVGVREVLTDGDLLDLRQIQVNGLQRITEGFTVVGVDTLSDDPATRPLTVRRLLILLGRVARREGNLVVFDANGPSLRRALRARFERLLGHLFSRGALAGGRAEDAFNVICDGRNNTSVDEDQGRVVIDLQVAPSHPLEFITVRLVRSDAGGFELTSVAA